MSAVTRSAATDAELPYECLPLPELRDFIFTNCGPEHRETVLGLLRESLGAPEEQRELYKEWRQAKSGDEPPGDQEVEREFVAGTGRKASVTLAGVQDLLSTRAGVVGERFGTIPEALSPTTDQANAHRLRGNFGDRVFAVDKQFYAFDGRSWVRDSLTPAQYAAELSRIIKSEATFQRAKFDALATDSPEAKRLEATKRRDQSKLQDALMSTARGAEIVRTLNAAESLERWSKEAESRQRQLNALGMWRDLCQVDPARLDAAAYLFNAMNCTVDLRTGDMQPHNPADLITQCAPAYYRPDADCPKFKEFMAGIFDQETVDFLQRWYGYRLTGETREQKMVLHIGDGGEGKSTLNDLIHWIMGDYAVTGARGLITGNGGENRHPTEFKDLKGGRLVTVHETNAGQDLQEGTVKWLTGSDNLKGRGMREDFQEWKPTQKIQLLSNHEPVIKGQDFGVWRRLLLVKYKVKFGTAEQVAEGKASRIEDPKLPDLLRSERDGIFSWLVQGAVEWYANGLRPPASVVAATQKYRSDQDRIGQFVKDRLCVSPDAWVSYPDLHRDYQIWCMQSGYQPLGLNKLLAELRRVVPSIDRDGDDRKQRTPDGKRKSVRGCRGVQLSKGLETAAERFPVVATGADADTDFSELL